MPGIREEVMVFLSAVLSGAIVRLAYRCISCFRQIVRHKHIVIEAEDLIFWLGSAVYLFVQIYHTSDGSIRWYFILGIVSGVILITVFLKNLEKFSQKIYTHKKKKFSPKA